MENPDDIFSDHKEIFSGSSHRDLDPVVRALTREEIPHKVLTSGSKYNPYLATTQSPNRIRVMVPNGRYAAARELLVQMELIDDVSEEDGFRAMMEDLEDEGLLEMLIDEGNYDAAQVAAARRILEERGRDVSEQTIRAERDAVASAQRVPLNIPFIWVVIWVIASIFLPPVGALASLSIFRGVGKDVNGENYYLYDAFTRTMAIVLFIISALALIGLGLGYWIYSFND